jgi:hypothetical protein
MLSSLLWIESDLLVQQVFAAVIHANVWSFARTARLPRVFSLEIRCSIWPAAGCAHGVVPVRECLVGGQFALVGGGSAARGQALPGAGGKVQVVFGIVSVSIPDLEHDESDGCKQNKTAYPSDDSANDFFAAVREPTR